MITACFSTELQLLETAGQDPALRSHLSFHLENTTPETFRYREKRSLPCRDTFTRWVHDSGINYSSFQIADVPGMNYNVRRLSKKPHIGKQIWTQKRIIFLSEVLSLSSYRGQDSSARATEAVKGSSALQHSGLQGTVWFNVWFQLGSISSINRLQFKNKRLITWKHVLVTLNPIF